jgi:predicted ATP-grasp superfamily ATP-dependent carboligase
VKLLVYEAVTGGSMVHLEPSASLVREADLMVRALIGDLREVPGVTLRTTRDYRLPVIPDVASAVVERSHDPLTEFERALEGVDAAWIIAPETGGVLERLSRRVVNAGVRLLGSSPEAVATAASKSATADCLAAAGLPAIPTFLVSDELPLYPGRWVVKPDDGAGAEGTVRCWDAEAAQELLRAGLVAQPWIGGDSLSISLLCAGSSTVLLSINRQEIAIADDRVSLSGLVVNAFADRDGFFAEMGRQVVAAIPGLYGWVGVDFIMSEGTPAILELNPRVTTSYCGLRAARGINPAALLLGAIAGASLPSSDSFPPGQPVRLDLGGA